MDEATYTFDVKFVTRKYRMHPVRVAHVHPSLSTRSTTSKLHNVWMRVAHWVFYNVFDSPDLYTLIWKHIQ